MAACVGRDHLCLNGHVINANTSSSNKFRVIKVNEGATLNLYDCDTESLAYNDGSDHDITTAKSFQMPDKAVTVSAVFEGEGGSEDSHSGTTTITAVKAVPFTYELVIPQAVEMTKAGIVAVGKPAVANVSGAKASTLISYTASGTDFKADGKTDMPASYYTNEDGTTELTADPITVYAAGNCVAEANLTTIYVGVSETDWNAAEAGTYTATVTFDFEAGEAEPQ